jgi:TatD DNase family protein
MLVDTHCHVHFNAYKQDMDDVIKRTLEQGVLMITIGTQSTTSKNGLAVAEKFDGMWATVGLHPNHLCEQEFWDEDELPPDQQATPKIITRCETFDHGYYLELTKHPKCVAIGECGLDYYRLPENVDRDEVIAKQKMTVREHFDLATITNKPVVIHCRDAHDGQIAIVREYVEAGKLSRRGVVHCFTGTLDEAKRYIDLGFYISFTGVITFPPRKSDNAPDGLSPLQRVVRDLPLDRILVETDAPYLTPEPYRGKRNEPGYVKFTAQKIAELKSISFDEVANATTANAKRLFGI